MKKKVSKKASKKVTKQKNVPQLNLKNIPTKKILPPLKKVPHEEVKKLNFAGFKLPAIHTLEKKEQKRILKKKK